MWNGFFILARKDLAGLLAKRSKSFRAASQEGLTPSGWKRRPQIRCFRLRRALIAVHRIIYIKAHACNNSTSSALGMDSAAPGRVTLMDEALLARLIQALSVMPAIKPEMK